MNRNSLEAFQAEAKALRVPQSMIEAVEKEMEKGVPKIEVHRQIPADKGMMDDRTCETICAVGFLLFQ